MSTPARPALRSARGVLAGTICGLGAVAAHQLAGGAYAPATALAVWPISVVLAMWLVTREVSPARLLLAALGTQAAWHTMLALTGEMAGPMAGEMGLSQPEHPHHPGAGMEMAHQMPAEHSMLGMYLAHAAVAVVATAVAAGADRTVLTLLVEWLLPALPRAGCALPVAHRPRVRPRLTLARDRWRAGPRTVRGPPFVLAL